MMHICRVQEKSCQSHGPAGRNRTMVLVWLGCRHSIVFIRFIAAGITRKTAKRLINECLRLGRQRLHRLSDCAKLNAVDALCRLNYPVLREQHVLPRSAYLTCAIRPPESHRCVD